jgi:predicted nuclease of restriction endonuclease-like (RecB) superfamily
MRANLPTDYPRLLEDIKGFSERNLKRMTQFFQEYPSLYVIGQQAVAQLKTVENEKDINVPQAVAQLTQSEQADLQHLIAQLPWGHNILLIQKIKDLNERLWYMRQTIEDGWSRNILDLQIKNNAYKRAAKAVTNFERTLPSPQSDLVQQTLKDPYIFDFLTLDEPFRERELETGLIRHLERFLIELGQGFSFVGRQYHLDIGEKDFYIDLLFYHLKLRCFVVIDLKKGEFKPDYAGKINFYCNVVDDMLKHETDNPTIGLILCQDKNKVLAEYALRGMNKPIGISEYELTRALPEELKSSLPTIEEIEAELGMDGGK